MKVHKGFEEKSRLGRLLINRGYISEGQLEAGLKIQHDTGQRLGEVLVEAGWLTERELHRVLKHQARYRNAAALVAMVTVPFQPLVTFASGNSNAALAPVVAGEMYGGFAAMTEEEMASVTAGSEIGLLERIETVADPETARDPVNTLKLASHIFSPVLSFVDSDLSISGVHYREGEPQYRIRDDGALQLLLPERIEEVRLDNIRVTNSQTPPIGNISIQDIRFHPDSRMTIHLH